jgi:polyisoprenoid-binding protein YceI
MPAVAHRTGPFLFGGLPVLVGMLAASETPAELADYRIDPAHATVAFLVTHVGFARVLGRFRSVEGTYRFDEATGELAGLEVVIETDSVFTDHERRDEHLRSDELLNVGEFPEMRFTATQARRTGERVFEVEGQLELLGQSRPLTLSVTWNKSGEYPFGGRRYGMGVSARGTFARSAYGMTYGIANGWVGDEVEIIIEIEAVRE